MNKEQMNLILKQQEKAYRYSAFFLPSLDDGVQPYVGDPMSYHEDGTYYIYYLKESGDSLNHSIYLTKTRDFLRYDLKPTKPVTFSLQVCHRCNRRRRNGYCNCCWNRNCIWRFKSCISKWQQWN